LIPEIDDRAKIFQDIEASVGPDETIGRRCNTLPNRNVNSAAISHCEKIAALRYGSALVPMLQRITLEL
jgi:hypothetical protein